MDKNISKAIAIMRMPVIIGPIMIHCAIKNIGVGSTMQYILSSIIGEVAVPLFYTISGFLFFSKIVPNWYLTKLKSRIRSLLVPYLLWNLIAYLVYSFAGEMQWNQFFESFWVVEGKMGHSPADGPLWFVRTLMMAAICSPIFFFINKKKYTSWISMMLVVAWVLGTPKFNQGIVKGFVFFNFGVWLAFQNFKLKESPSKYCFYCSLLLFIIIGAIDILTIEMNESLHMIIHRLSTLIGFFVFFYVCFVVKGKISSLLCKCGGASFFVYCIHEPILFSYKNTLVSILGANVFTFVILVFVTTILSLAIYTVLNKFTPKLLHLLSGSR